MKKYAAVILALIMVTISAGSSYTYAAKTVSGSRNATGWLTGVRYTSDGGSEAVSITAKNYEDYSVMELSDPQRIVLDIFNVAAPGKQQIVEAGGEIIKRIRYAQFDRYTARVVLEVKGEAEYGVENTDAGLVLYIGERQAGENQKEAEIIPVVEEKPALSVQQPTYRNIEYNNNGDRVYFTLKDAVLTEGDEFLEELYTGSYDNANKKYTVIFSTGQADLGNGVMEINDQYLKSVEVRTSEEEGTTRLTFTGTGKNTYFIYTRNNGITYITVLRPAIEKQKLVVIDAGHGGKDSGAVFNDMLEKDLNLDIAKRLNTLLEKKGVKTYMLREDDSSIANYERAYIANKLNAKLYLSVHNNAMDNKSYRGTMTLYYPSNSSGFTGKSFAGIIHQKMLGSLKTVDRKTKERSDLVVLKATTMPAAIAEVAFMTNSTDRSNLRNASFRQKAAQALCDSVIKALTKVK